MAEEALLVEPNDNRTKSAEAAAASSRVPKSDLLDFLDDSKNDSVKTLKHMISFPPSCAGLCAAGAGPAFQRLGSVDRMVPMRICYGMQEWKLWYYPQTAQWPQPGEALTREEQEEEEEQMKSREVNASEKSAADKAKDFFNELFGSVRSRNETSSSSSLSSASPGQGGEQHPDGSRRLPSCDDGEEHGTLLRGNVEGENTAM